MFKKSLVVACTMLFAASALAQTGASTAPPGQRMHNPTKFTGPGAFEYAPGQDAECQKVHRAGSIDGPVVFRLTDGSKSHFCFCHDRQAKAPDFNRPLN